MLESEDPGEALLALLRSPNIADRRPLFEQYDCVVQSRTVRRPGGADAAVLALPARDGVQPGSRSRSTATAGASPPTPTAARSRRCSSAPPTSPVSAPSRSA